jgi:hypothetical protein
MNKIIHIRTMEESSYAQIKRERIEKENQEKEDAKNKKLADIAEKKRMHKLLVPYLDKLQDNLEEKDILSFWIFPEEAGFTKHKNLNYDEMQKFIFANVNKYKNKLLSNISIGFYHNDKPNSTRRKLNINIYMITDIMVYPISKDGIIGGDKNTWGATIAWETNDFKTTKFSLKLLQIIFRQIVAKVFITLSIFGYPLTNVIKTLEKKGVDFQNTLVPLAGTIKK